MDYTSLTHIKYLGKLMLMPLLGVEYVIGVKNGNGCDTA